MIVADFNFISGGFSLFVNYNVCDLIIRNFSKILLFESYTKSFQKIFFKYLDTFLCSRLVNIQHN